MAILTFTSMQRGELDPDTNHGVFPHGYCKAVPTVHTWTGFTIGELVPPSRPRALFLPRAYLIAKLAAGEVPDDYGVDLAEGLLYQKAIIREYVADLHPDAYSDRTETGTQPFYTPELETMTLSLVRGEDAAIWGGTGRFSGIKGVTYQLRISATLVISYAWGQYSTGAYMHPEPGAGLFETLLAPSDPKKSCHVNLSTPTTHALTAGEHIQGVRKRLELSRAKPWPLPDAPKVGGRKLMIEEENPCWTFPAARFEACWPFLVYGLSADGTRLRIHERNLFDSAIRTPDGPRLHIHYGQDAWRFVATLPGRRLIRERGAHNPLWLNFIHLFGFCVSHREVTERTCAFRGLPLPEQERIWAVPGMSSALSHFFNSLKARLSALSEPLDLFQGKCNPAHGHMVVFHGDDGLWKVYAKRRVDRDVRSKLWDFGHALGNSRFVPDMAPAVQHVAPEALTSTRLIDL